MQKILVGIFIIGFLITGCKQIIMWKYGITNPKTETPESILNFVKTYNQDIENIYIFKDSSSYLNILQDSTFKKNTLSALFFNKEGFFISYRNIGQCQWSGGAFLHQYSRDSIYLVDSSFHLNSLMNKIIPLISLEKIPDSTDNDLTIITIWAKFIGKYNERLFSVSNVAKSRQDIKIRIILLNIDMLENWNLRKDQMIK